MSVMLICAYGNTEMWLKKNLMGYTCSAIWVQSIHSGLRRSATGTQVSSVCPLTLSAMDTADNPNIRR